MDWVDRVDHDSSGCVNGQVLQMAWESIITDFNLVDEWIDVVKMASEKGKQE